MRRYIFDVTDLLGYLRTRNSVSGIQRVVLETIAQAQAELGRENVFVGFVDRRTDQYNTVAIYQLGPFNPLDLTDWRRAFGVRLKIGALPGLAATRGRPLKRAWVLWRYDSWARNGRRRPFAKMGITADHWTALRDLTRKAPGRYLPSRSLDHVARPGDHMVVLDNVPRLRPHLAEARSLGMEVTVLVHDMIPLVRPDLVIPARPKATHDLLQGVVPTVHRFIANSRQTARDLSRIMPTLGGDQPVHVVPLAQARIAVPETSTGQATREYVPDLAGHIRYRDAIRRLANQPFALIVGTREIRKNLLGVAKAWQQLVKGNTPSLPQLVIAGRDGWLNHDFDAFMTATDRLGGLVDIIDSPSDMELDWLYRRCQFTITASFYEGWGLPVGESLAYGKTAVVSEVSSLPEVGGDLVEYCDPADVASIAAACRLLIENPAHRSALERKIANARLRSWQDVARDLLEHLVDEEPIHDRREAPALITAPR